MRKSIVMANWKSNGTFAQAKDLCEKISQHYANNELNVDVVVCVPFPYLTYVQNVVTSAGVSVGAENLSQYGNGAYTGEVSANMLQDLDIPYVIIGHSERRSLFAETDQVVQQKASQALEAGLKAVLCVGETLDERQNGQVEEVITRQVNAVLSKISQAKQANIIIAYEPVWAIGTGLAATPEQVNEVHLLIRNVVSKINPNLENTIRIIYGGSVNSGNAAELFKLPDVDGGLIGGASLKPNDFNQIITQADN
ncbi:triose-phosphate isomerase [Francisellaceae bacterium]|nr:triose-phosphate isomerase [Francisellaceae bacterium]